MNDKNRKRATAEELAQEADAWDKGLLTPQDWVDAPEAVPYSSTSKTIRLHIPAQMLAIVKELAHRQGIGYQILIKRWLDDRIREERDKITNRKMG